MAHFISAHSVVVLAKMPTSSSENHFTSSAVWIPDPKHPLVDRALYSTVARWSKLPALFEVVAEILMYSFRELREVPIDYSCFTGTLKRSARSN